MYYLAGIKYVYDIAYPRQKFIGPNYLSMHQVDFS